MNSQALGGSPDKLAELLAGGGEPFLLLLGVSGFRVLEFRVWGFMVLGFGVIGFGV